MTYFREGGFPTLPHPSAAPKMLILNRVKNGSQENNDIKVSVLNVYFSDHDTVRVQISKKQIVFNIMK